MKNCIVGMFLTHPSLVKTVKKYLFPYQIRIKYGYPKEPQACLQHSHTRHILTGIPKIHSQNFGISELMPCGISITYFLKYSGVIFCGFNLPILTYLYSPQRTNHPLKQIEKVPPPIAMTVCHSLC